MFIKNNSKSELYTHGRPLITYLDHSHCGRKNVHFLGKFLPLEDLWCSPLGTAATLKLGAPDIIQVLSDSGKAKDHNADTTRIIYKDILLSTCQYGCQMRVGMVMHSHDTPMDHVAGVEVVEPLSAIRYLDGSSVR